MKILAINPGSTSTKIAVFEDAVPLMTHTIRHSVEELAPFPRVLDQLDYRRDLIIKALADNPPSGDELERMRLHAVSDSLEALDTPFSIMKVIVSQYAVGMPDNYFQRQQEVIASIDSYTIGEMARRYLSADSLRISIAGNPG